MSNFRNVSKILIALLFLSTLHFCLGAKDALAAKVCPDGMTKISGGCCKSGDTLYNGQCCKLGRDGKYSGCAAPSPLVDKVETPKEPEPKVVPSSGGSKKDPTMNSCNAGVGLFSGLLATGKRIFEGLRDLIYVVAGFGIIGVAVGGFFGNLNWKWLGAIIIGLIVVASTGEVINTIVGCDGYSSGMITDTLK